MSQVLPTADPTLSQAYTTLIAELDERIAQLAEALAARLRCAPTCSSCCMAFSLLPVEAAILQEKLRHLSLSEPADPCGCCALLRDQLCQAYPARPVICRTQGLPLAYLDPEAGTIEISACQLNFAEDFAFSEEGLLFMDPFNERLATLNLHYCRSHGLATNRRIAIADL